MRQPKNTSGTTKRRRSFRTVVLTAALVAPGLGVMATPASAGHVVCGDVITNNTTLESDVGPCAGDGLVVAANDVTLNLNGFKVFGLNGDGDRVGIRLRGVSGVIVHNGTVTGFDAGVVVGGGSGNSVRQITAQDNINDFRTPPCEMGDGIVIMNSSTNSVEHNRVIHNGPFGGITLLGNADDNVVRNNEVRDNNVVTPPGRTGCGNRFQDEGIRVEGPGAERNRIERNVVVAGLLAGIGLHGHVCNPQPHESLEPANSDNSLIGNRISATAGSSIASGINILRQGPPSIVCPAQRSTIVGNTSSGNQSDGIFVSSNSAQNTISRNTVENNGVGGIFLSGPNFANRFTNVGPTLFDLVVPDAPPYTEGTHYQVMPGSGTGDVTGRLVAIDISIPAGTDRTSNPNPVDTSTSGCEMSDYSAAGFGPGDVALLQRGTCTFVSKVSNAVAAGASAVVMFNEGQATPDRVTAAFGSVGPQNRPVLSAHYGVGFDLYQLTRAGSVTVRVVTNTTNQRVFVAPGANRTTLIDNRGRGNGVFDGEDGNANCASAPQEAASWVNDWFRNWFGTVNQACVANGGTGWGGGPGRSGDAPGTLEGGGQEHNRGVGDRHRSFDA